MQAYELTALNNQLLLLALAIGMAFGAIAQRTHFCTMGAVSDVFNIGDWTRVRQWGLALGVAMVGFAGLVYAGQVDPTQVLYASTRWLWLSAVLGGILFGLGMVLASGCGGKNLVRVDGGSLKSLVLVLGLAAFATLKGITAVVRVATVDRGVVDLPMGTGLVQWRAGHWGLPPALTALLLGLGLGGSLVLWVLSDRGFRSPVNLLAGVGIGGLVVAMWWVSGHLGHVSEHPKTLQEAFLATNSGRAEALSFVAPVATAMDCTVGQGLSGLSTLNATSVVALIGIVTGAVAGLRYQAWRVDRAA